MYKPKALYVNVSSSFMVRARCTLCDGQPLFYYRVRLPDKIVDYNLAQKRFATYSKWLCFKDDWYLQGSPRHFNSNNEFSHRVTYKGFNPALHRTKGTAPSGISNFMEVVSCWCGKTSWAINQRATKNKAEIVNRKGRYSYPKKIDGF